MTSTPVARARKVGDTICLTLCVAQPRLACSASLTMRHLRTERSLLNFPGRWRIIHSQHQMLYSLIVCRWWNLALRPWILTER